VKYALANPASHDFGAALYTSARAWIDGGRPYGPQELPNLNPPTVTRVLLVPFARLELRHALVAWNVSGALCLAFSWWLLWSNRVGTPSQRIGSLGVMLCTFGAAGLVWLEGQITWFLLPAAALSWFSYRRGHRILAGICLGVIVAAKPFFAAAALPLGITTCIAAAATSIPLSLISVMASGWPVWADWLRTVGQITWLGRPGNASVWGFAARAAGATNQPVSFALIGAVGVAIVATVAVGLLVWTATRKDPEQRWLLAVSSAILISPLGWTHYTPLLAPALATWFSAARWNPVLVCAVILFCIPPGLPYGVTSWSGAVTLGSTYTYALALLWIGVAAGEVRSRE
jgi:hypothetical protein